MLWKNRVTGRATVRPLRDPHAPPAAPRAARVACVHVWTTANHVCMCANKSKVHRWRCNHTERSPRMTDVPSAMRRHGILNLQDRHCSGLPKHSPLQYSHHFFVVHDMERLMVPPDDFLSNDIDRRIACIAFIGVATGTSFFSGRRISTT